MTDLKYTRFTQRRKNLQDALAFLNETITTPSPERIQAAAAAKAFELCFELCWKTLKDYLEYQGMTAAAPRDVLKMAFATKVIRDGQAWIDMLDERNQLAHIYQKNQAATALEKIRNDYLPLLHELVEDLNSK